MSSGFGANVVGLRVIHRLGPERVLRFALLVYLLAALIQVMLFFRPDVMHPTAIGTDSSNYYAAGLRLNAGHPLYSLEPGDRPVPFNPPYSTVPLLSPPTVAVLWRVIAVLPGDVAMTAWWFAGMLTLLIVFVGMIPTASLRRLGLMILIAPAIALTAFSGNLESFLTAMLVGAWWFAQRGRSDVAGGLIAVAGALKVTPLFLAWWFVVRRDWRGLAGLFITGAIVGVVVLAGAGLTNWLDYLAVVHATSTIGATDPSLPGLLRNFGLDPTIASLSIPLVIALGALGMWLLRDRPGASYALGALVCVYSSPVVLLPTFSLLLAAGAPFPAARRADPAPLSRAAPSGFSEEQRSG